MEWNFCGDVIFVDDLETDAVELLLWSIYFLQKLADMRRGRRRL
jgi:hypothetical protein